MYYAIVTKNDRIVVNVATGQLEVYTSFKKAAENMSKYSNSFKVIPVIVNGNNENKFSDFI